VIEESYREGIQNETAVASFKATLTIFCHLPGDTVENQEKLQLAKPMALEKLETNVSNRIQGRSFRH
jgi:hypothetical protein